MLISVKLLTKYVVITYALGSVHENSASESKPFQSRSKGEIHGPARRKERLSRSKLKQAFLVDSDAELFMYLIQCIRFGSRKVRRLNRALVAVRTIYLHTSLFVCLILALGELKKVVDLSHGVSTCCDKVTVLNYQRTLAL